MLRALLPIALATALGAGCYAEDGVGYTYDYGYASPSLVYAAPGVEVVADYDYPVFFADGLYWRWYGGGWYSSHYWDRGWGYARNVPYGVRGISRPWAYAHYHPGGFRGGMAFRGPAYRGGGVYRGAPGYRGGFRGGQATRGQARGGRAAGGHRDGHR